MYHAAVTASVELARDEGLVYETFRGSPASEGILQFDMWGVTPGSGRYDWAKVRADVIEHGMANSLLLAPMPTASTASILGNNESTEPFTSNIYSRRVLAGEFTVINQHLLRDLIRLGIWSDNLKHRIIANAGSVVGLDEVPKDIQELYKCVWEMKQRRIVDMAADRGAFICQSQSLNIHIAAPTPAIMTSLHFHTWKSGLKTGQYYLRTKPAAAAIQFTTDKAAVATGNAIIDSSSSGKGSSKDAAPSAGKLSQADEAKIVGAICTMEEGCISCGS
jgi:ribonucleoside-diphosphate reductase alpha chain